MGGSGGGGGYFSSDPKKARMTLSSERATRSEEYEAQCAQTLQSFLGEINNRNVEAINAHLEEVKKIFEGELDDSVTLRFGGSVAKHTYVDGLSDVDCLVLLDKCELAEGPPSEALAYFARRLREDLPVGLAIEEGAVAVTVRFPDVDLQLLPAISCAGAVQIADSLRDEWARVRPREFSAALSQVNEENGRKVVPVVKLAKAIIANLPESVKLSGYHAESLAVAIFRDYEGPLTHKAMLREYFDRASMLVRSPIKDRTGQSIHVDEYLGRADSLERKIASDYFARISRRMSTADETLSVGQWATLIDG